MVILRVCDLVFLLASRGGRKALRAVLDKLDDWPQPKQRRPVLSPSATWMNVRRFVTESTRRREEVWPWYACSGN